MIKNINNTHRECHSALNNYENYGRKDQNEENTLAVNYPLSMSHSYIVFSEKDSTMNNTNKIFGKISKRAESSNVKKLSGLEDKL